MPNSIQSQETTPADPVAATLLLGQRVSAIERGMTHLENSVSSQITQLSNTMSSQVQSVTNQLQSLAQKYQEGSRTPWGILIAAAVFLLGFVGAIGGLAYSPILNTTTRLETSLDKQNDRLTTAIERLAASTVTRDEIDTRSVRNAEDRQRVEMALRALQEQVFQKETHIQQWARIEASIANAQRLSESRDEAMQRELDTLQKQLGDTYTARDAILDLKARIEALDRELRTKP